MDLAERPDLTGYLDAATFDIIHATCVAAGTRCVLLTGPSGSGKSGTALEMMALGARLVSDDRTRITATGEGVLMASAAPNLSGRIEARGLGILAADPVPRAIVAAVVDMATVASERLPPIRHTRLLGIDVPLLHKVESRYFPAALVQYLKGGLIA